MKTSLLILLVGFVCLSIVSASEDRASFPQTATEMPHTDRLPGVDLAQGLAQITGTAISPLLGVSAVGAWRYYHTPERMRDRLPWFCRPAVWSFGFAILFLCLLKDVAGTVTPPFIKKPFDLVELFENKLSALVASTAFIPFVAAQVSQWHDPALPGAAFLLPYSTMHPLAVIGWDWRLLFVPLAMLAFAVVWMVGHTINVLIILCPFGFIDTLLKLTKACLLSSVVVSYLVNPYFGAAVSLFIIGVSALLAPSALRLTVFGTLFALDTLTPWRAARSATPDAVHGFVARPLAGVPTRTYGRVVRADDGKIHFRYRPWFVLPPRVLEFSTASLAMSQGAIFPSLLAQSDSSPVRTKLVLFLPRYRTRERVIADHLGIADIHDSALNKGFKNVRAWLAETIGFGEAKGGNIVPPNRV